MKTENGKMKVGIENAKFQHRLSKIAHVSSILIILFGISACATSSELTDALSAAGEVASAAGYDGAGAVLNAGASVSKAMEEITPENEYYIGRAVAATILTNYKVYSNATSEAYLNKICNTIAINSERPELYNGYHVKILDSTEVNAFATSGGHIFITRGLLACTDSEDALAGVIAHEIAHIQLQHSLKAIKTSRRGEAVFSVISAAATATNAQLATAMSDLTNASMEALNNGYSKSQEFDADSLALTLMANAGYDPAAMLDMLNQLKAAQGEKSSGMYKTHPSPDQRISNVNSELEKVSAPADTKRYRTARFAKNK